MSLPCPATIRRPPIVAMLALAFLTGCGGYEGASPEAFQYAKAVYNLANRRAESQIEPCSERVEAAHAAGDLSDREAGWINAMLADARRGDWEAAMKASRQLMQDQVQK